MSSQIPSKKRTTTICTWMHRKLDVLIAKHFTVISIKTSQALTHILYHSQHDSFKGTTPTTFDLVSYQEEKIISLCITSWLIVCYKKLSQLTKVQETSWVNWQKFKRPKNTMLIWQKHIEEHKPFHGSKMHLFTTFYIETKMKDVDVKIYQLEEFFYSCWDLLNLIILWFSTIGCVRCLLQNISFL